MTTIIRLTPIDLPSVKAHLKRLSPDDRYTRFCSNVSDEFIDSYVSKFNTTYGTYDTGFVALSDEGDIVGFIHLSVVTTAGRVKADLGLSVEPTVRHQGVGKQLFSRAVQLCEAVGVSSININCLSSNKAMQRIVRAYDIPITTSYGESVGELSGNGIASLPLLFMSCINDVIGRVTHQYTMSLKQFDHFIELLSAD